MRDAILLLAPAAVIIYFVAYPAQLYALTQWVMSFF